MSSCPVLASDEAIAAASSSELIEAARRLLVTAFHSAGDDPAGHSSGQLLEQIEALQSVTNAAQGVQTLRMAQAAAIEEVRDTETGVWREVRHELGWGGEWASAELGPLLAWGPRQVETRLQDALDAVTLTPRLLREVGNGRLELAKMSKVLRGLQFASEDACNAIESELLDNGISGMTTTQIAHRVTRSLAKIDPIAAESAAGKQRRYETGVFSRASAIPGLCEMTCILPTDSATAIMASVEDLARQLHRVTTTNKSLGECRADALADLVLQNVELQTTVVFQLPVDRNGFAPSAAVRPHPNAAEGDTSADGARPEADAAGTSEPMTVGGAEADAAGASEPSAAVAGDIPDRSAGIVRGANAPGAAVAADPPDALRQVAALFDELFPDPYAEVAAGRARWLRHDDLPPQDDDLPPDPDDDDFPGNTAAPPSGEIDWDCELGRLLAMQAAQTQSEIESGPDRTRVRFADVVVPGIGVIAADHLTHLAAEVGTAIARRLVDAGTGRLVDATGEKYRPTAALARFVRERDGHCRFPSCTQPAKYCDVDHVIKWPDGPTQPGNLQSLCRHHHRVKHETAWLVSMTDDGVCSWTSPHARSYPTYPVDFGPATTVPVGAAAAPSTAGPG